MYFTLELRISEEQEASSVGIGTNRCFPPIAPPKRATDCNGGTNARPNGKSFEGCFVHTPAKGPGSTRHDSPIVSLTPRNYQ